MSQSKTHCELCKLRCQQLLSERKLEYAGKSQKELKNLLIEPGLQEAVEAKLPVGNQPRPDIDTGQLVAQVLLTELTLQQKQLNSKMKKHKMETVKKRQETDWVSERAGDIAQKASAAKDYGRFVQVEQSQAAKSLTQTRGNNSSPLFPNPLSLRPVSVK